MKRTPFKVNPEKVKAWRDRSRKSLKPSRLRKVGKIGRANAKANRTLANLWQYHQINYCEAPFVHDCDGMLTNAHRHKRAHYKGDAKQLSDFKQVVRLCITAHSMIEHDSELTEEVFIRLRGNV